MKEECLKEQQIFLMLIQEEVEVTKAIMLKAEKKQNFFLWLFKAIVMLLKSIWNLQSRVTNTCQGQKKSAYKNCSLSWKKHEGYVTCSMFGMKHIFDRENSKQKSPYCFSLKQWFIKDMNDHVIAKELHKKDPYTFEVIAIEQDEMVG